MSLTRVVVGFFVFTLITSSVARAELVAHWRLNEGSGDIFVDTAGGHDGFLPQDGDREDGLVPTIEWVTDDGPIPGVLDASVLFTGADGPSFIETPFPGIGDNNPRTIAAWVKAEPQTTNTAMVAYGANRAGEKWHFRIDTGGGGTRIRTEFSGGQNFGGDTVAADGEWRHLVSVFPEGGTVGDDVIHYIDGVVEPKAGGNSPVINTATITDDEGAFPVHIGYAIPHGGRYFIGQISDVRIYDEGLSQEQVLSVMAGGGLLPPGATPGDFNQDGAIDAADFDILASNYHMSFTPNDDSFFKGDFDTNLRVDLKDFLSFREVFAAQATGGGVASVPEPSSLLPLLLPGIVLLRRRR